MAEWAAITARAEARWAAGAAIWAFLFAAISFYWAAGGSFGASTVGGQVEDFARTVPGFFLLLWVDAVVKTLLGLLGLALVYTSWQRVLPWGAYLPTIAWFAGFAMAAYGAVELTVTGISALLMVTGILPVSASVDWGGIVGHLVIWDPYWLLGGALFLLAAETAGVRVRGRIRRWMRPRPHLL